MAVSPTKGRLVAEILGVVHDVPVFLTAPLYRHWHRHWGARPDEITDSLPGDGLLPRAQFRATPGDHRSPRRPGSVAVARTGRRASGWLVQQTYLPRQSSAVPSATTIVPEFQRIETGQWVPMAPWGTPSDHNAFQGPLVLGQRVAVVDEAGQHMGVAVDADGWRRHAVS